ncbi:MAG: type II toxin-antitoxin system RelE/ParE family toxin [Campylobacter sp.]|nr:type II toxin-antitoxin system RelE/ParE family toxin [Campylobacter sp.]
MWSVEFLNEKVRDEFLSLPNEIRQRGYKMFELLENMGNTLGEPYTKSLKDGLFEIRIKANVGIARSIYCYAYKKRIIILLSFIKKSQKTPKNVLDLAKERLKEFQNGDN